MQAHPRIAKPIGVSTAIMLITRPRAEARMANRITHKRPASQAFATSFIDNSTRQA